MKKAIFFIDANNWYHNVSKYFKPSDIDIIKIVDYIIKLKQYSLVDIYWYISVPSIKDGEKMYFQHLSYLDHLKNKGIKVITRKLQRLSNNEVLKKKIALVDSLYLCKICKPIIEAQFLEIADIRKKEKGIDVAIVVDMINMSLIAKKCDVCVLISGDADFIPALELLKNNQIEILTSSVPLGYSSELRKKTPYLVLTEKILTKCFRDYKDSPKNKNGNKNN